MVGSFITRGLVMVLGYAYPAYECFKTVEKNKPEIEQLLFWCQYWILVAVLTVCERIGDTFISWLPMYGEAKLAFFVYLWYPKTRGTKYVYDSFFRPYIAKHEPEIDRNLQELRVRAGDMAVLYWQKAASYGQTRIFEVLQFVASQSQARPQPAQRQQRQAGVRAPPPVPPSTRPPTAQQPQQPALHQAAPPASPKPPTSTTQQPPPEAAPPASPKPPQPSLPQKTIPTQPDESSQSEVPSTEESMQTPTSVAVVDGNVSSLQQDTVMEEAIRVTRGRLRKNRAAANH